MIEYRAPTNINWWKGDKERILHMSGQIDLYLFCYEWTNDFIDMIRELKASRDEDNIKLALAILENYENKILKKESINLNKWK